MDDIIRFYTEHSDEDRLRAGWGALELARTKAIVLAPPRGQTHGPRLSEAEASSRVSTGGITGATKPAENGCFAVQSLKLGGQGMFFGNPLIFLCRLVIYWWHGRVCATYA